MSSSSAFIGIQQNNGTFLGIHCAKDGYPEYTGKMLYQHYNNTKKVNELIGLGAIECIGAEIGKKIDCENDDIRNFLSKQCIAHYRDMGKKYEQVIYNEITDIEKKYQNIYIYTIDKVWRASCNNSAFTDLVTMISDENSKPENIKMPTETAPKIYAFVFKDSEVLTVRAADFRTALIKIATYNMGTNKLFEHALDGLVDDKECIALYNQFAYANSLISHVYLVANEIGIGENDVETLI